jgi:hypothetical protein
VSPAEGFCCLVDPDQARAAASINGHAAAIDVVKVRQSVRHNGDAVAGGRISGLVFRVSKTYLLVVYAR